MQRAKQFSQFIIIFNPNSTGNSPEVAKKVRNSLKKFVSVSKVHMQPTQHAGHAVELAYKAATQYVKPLIISVSGDGGYNEVINGVLQAIHDKKAKNPVVTVIGAGNANDHYRVVHNKRSISQMLKHKITAIDLLKITVTHPHRDKEVRYAHSYAGIGMTPRVAQELNQYKLNPFREAFIIIKALITLRSVKIERNGIDKRVDTLLFANIREMAKVLTLTDNNSLHDGQFEVIELNHRSIFSLLITLLKATTIGLKEQPQQKDFTFTLLENQPLQIDGEIITCQRDSILRITVAKDAVQTLL